MNQFIWAVSYGPYHIYAFKVIQDQINTIQFRNEAIFSPDTIFKAEDEAFDLEGLVLKIFRNFYCNLRQVICRKARMMNLKRKI